MSIFPPATITLCYRESLAFASIHRSVLCWVFNCISRLYESNGMRMVRIGLRMSKIRPKNQTMFTRMRPRAHTCAPMPANLVGLVCYRRPPKQGRERDLVRVREMGNGFRERMRVRDQEREKKEKNGNFLMFIAIYISL